jgi:sporulation protein YlmC with PRC-barrel domain
MKPKFKFLAGAILAAGLPPSIWAQTEPGHVALGEEKAWTEFNRIEIKNFQDESLGRISDLGVDLVNGRIVEVLVETDPSLGSARKIVAVPPVALFADTLNEVYRLNASADAFKTAPGIDLSQWSDAGRSERVAAAYHLFGQEPYFLEPGAVPGKTDLRPKVALGYVERSSRILNLPVENLQNVKFGKVWSMTLDIPEGRIIDVIVLAPGKAGSKSIVPAMALSFNPARDTLLLDDSKLQYADEPRYAFTEAAYGQKPRARQEPYTSSRTSAALEQGSSYRDVDRTVLINRNVRDAKIDGRNVQVGTIDGRVTLRGWVETDEDRRRIGEIAVAASHLELVDNQITVGKPSPPRGN